MTYLRHTTVTVRIERSVISFPSEVNPKNDYGRI